MTDSALPERRRGPNGILYTEKEFVNWYGGSDEWFAAADEHDDEFAEPPLKAMLVRGDRAAAHQYLIKRGVVIESMRERVMRRVLPPPPSKEPPPPYEPPKERYEAAAAALKAGEVAIFTVADSTNVAFAANLLRSYSSKAEGDVSVADRVQPMQVYCADEATHAQLGTMLAAASEASSSSARLRSIPEEGPASLERATMLSPAVRREWLACTIMHRELEACEYSIFVDPSAFVARSGLLAFLVEALSVSAGTEDDDEDDHMADDAAREARLAASSPPCLLPASVSGAAEVGDGVALLLASAGVEQDGSDGPLGLRWLKLLSEPADGVELCAAPRTPRHAQLEKLRAFLTASSANVLPADLVPIAPSELARFGALELCVGSYLKAGQGSGLCYFQVVGRGLSSGVIAARSTRGTRRIFDVSPADAAAAPDWTLETYLNRAVPGRVPYRALPLDLVPNGRLWVGDGGRRLTAADKQIVLPWRRHKLISFNGAWLEPREKRMLMVREDMWLLTADEERSLVHDGTNQGDEDEDDLVIV